MYDKKLKYKILSIFAATVMTFTAITPVWAEEENLEAVSYTHLDVYKRQQKTPRGMLPVNSNHATLRLDNLGIFHYNQH